MDQVWLRPLSEDISRVRGYLWKCGPVVSGHMKKLTKTSWSPNQKNDLDVLSRLSIAVLMVAGID